MKKKIGFVAIGQAGGNIGKLFEDKGFSVLYLNTSQEDLQTLKNAKYTYHIAGGEGCNKDRAKAKRLVMEDFDNISKEIYEKMDVSMIYVVFAAGGGTGSGCGPMLIDLLLGDIAAGESKVESVGAITVIPSEKESPKTQINCYECFEELTAISSIAIESMGAEDAAPSTRPNMSRKNSMLYGIGYTDGKAFQNAGDKEQLHS